MCPTTGTARWSSRSSSPRRDTTLDEATLDAFCRGRLSGYKRPKRFFVIDDLERSAAGKANYRAARALASELVAAG